MALPYFVAKLIWGRGKRISDFAYAGHEPTSGREMTDLERIFWNHEGPVVHKWLHYFEIYERYFRPWRGKPVRFLELGVSDGGSLEMWREYLGEQATIFGIDIDERCAAFDGKAGQVRIGSQTDVGFLNSVVAEMGGLDIVVDDGSHDSVHIRKSLATLFPHLSQNGIYLVEDLHAAYWTRYSGGYRRPASFISTAKKIVDDIHHWYHDRSLTFPELSGKVGAIHFHDSIVVLEKADGKRPQHHRKGTESASRIAASPGRGGR